MKRYIGLFAILALLIAVCWRAAPVLSDSTQVVPSAVIVQDLAAPVIFQIQGKSVGNLLEYHATTKSDFKNMAYAVAPTITSRLTTTGQLVIIGKGSGWVTYVESGVPKTRSGTVTLDVNRSTNAYRVLIGSTVKFKGTITPTKFEVAPEGPAVQ